MDNSQLQAFPILYQDEHCIAIHKPSGIHVHQSKLAPHEISCVPMLRDQIGTYVYPVHRIDRSSSGIVLFALQKDSMDEFFAMFRNHAVTKMYQAIVRGYFPESVSIDYAINADGGIPKEAKTDCRRVLTAELDYPSKQFPTTRISLIEANLLTGRRHQIRMHCAHLRHPIAGDVRHGDGTFNTLFRNLFGLHRLLLFSSFMEFVHPISGKQISIECNPITSSPEVQSLFSFCNWNTTSSR